MALRMLNGYDYYPTGDAFVNAVADGFFSNAQFFSILLTGAAPGRFGRGKNLRQRSAISGRDVYQAVGQRFTSETCVLGAAIFIPKDVGAIPGSKYGFGFYDGEGGTGNQMTLTFEETGIIRLYRGGIGGTLVATTAAGTFNLDQWFWLEIKVKIHNTSGLLEVRVNTVTKISFIGDTRVGTPLLGAAYGWDSLHWATETFNGPIINTDDMYLLDDTGTENTDYLGNVRVNTQFAISNGDTIDFSVFGVGSNWQAVIGTALTDSQYVYAGTVGDEDLYDMDPNVTAQNIFGIQVRGAYRQDDSTQMVARNIIKTGGTVFEGATDHYLSGSYTYYREIWELNPDTGVGWTSAELNALQAGTKVQAIG